MIDVHYEPKATCEISGVARALNKRVKNEWEETEEGSSAMNKFYFQFIDSLSSNIVGSGLALWPQTKYRPDADLFTRFIYRK